MANTVRHKHTAINPSTATSKPDDVDGANWLEEHILNAPEIGAVLVGDPSESDGVGWVLPGDAGFVLVTAGGGSLPLWQPVSFDVVLTAPGDLARGRAGTGVSERLGVGTERQVLTVFGGMPEWQHVVPDGGVTGDILYFSSPNVLALRTIGTPGQVLAVIGGVPRWSTLPASFSNPMTTLGDLIVALAGGTPQRLGIGVNTQVLTVVGGVPAWANPTGGGSGSLPITTAGDLVAGDVAGLPVRFAVGAPGQVLTAIGTGGKLQWQTPAVGDMSNPMLAPADLIVGGVAGTPLRLAKGADTQILTVVAGALAWATPVASGMSNPMTAGGDIIIGGASGTPLRLAKGADSHVLTLVGGVPAWVVAPGAGGGMTNPMTGLGDIIYGLAAGVPQRLAPAADGQFLSLAAGIPSWVTLPVDPGFANPMTTLWDLIRGGAAGAPTRFGIGANGTVLTITAGALSWVAPAAPGMANPMTTDGDIIVGGASGVPLRLGAGADGFILKLLSGQPTWQPAPAGLTWPLLAPNGTIAAPSYSFVSDPSIGMFRDGAGHLTLATSTSLIVLARGGAVAWWVDSANGWQPGSHASYDLGAALTAIRNLYAITTLYQTNNAPATPPAGWMVTYAKPDNKLYAKNDAGVEMPLVGMTNPMTAAGDLIIGGTSGTPTRKAIGVSGDVLTTVGGVPVWQAPTGSALGSGIYVLPLDQARFPDGSAGNAFPQPAERISTGTPPTNVPKLVELTYLFDSTIIESLIWKGLVPASYTGGTVTLVVKWSMAGSSGGSNIRIIASLACVVDDSTDARALVATTATTSADIGVPGTVGQQRETRLALTGLVNVAAGRKFVVTLSLCAAGASNATVDRVLEAAALEFV